MLWPLLSAAPRNLAAPRVLSLENWERACVHRNLQKLTAFHFHRFPSSILVGNSLRIILLPDWTDNKIMYSKSREEKNHCYLCHATKKVSNNDLLNEWMNSRKQMGFAFHFFCGGGSLFSVLTSTHNFYAFIIIELVKSCIPLLFILDSLSYTVCSYHLLNNHF